MGYYIQKDRLFFGYRSATLESIDGKPIKFQTLDQARQYSADFSNQPYLLEPQEHSRPAISIMPYARLPDQLKDAIKIHGHTTLTEIKRTQYESDTALAN